MALSRDTSSSNFALERFFGRYSTLSNFHGQDLTYNVSCISGGQGSNGSCENVKVSDQSYQLSKSLDFLGSTISLLGFFAFEDLIAFFDPYRMNVYFPQTDQYIQYGIGSVLNYSCTP